MVECPIVQMPRIDQPCDDAKLARLALRWQFEGTTPKTSVIKPGGASSANNEVTLCNFPAIVVFKLGSDVVRCS